MGCDGIIAENASSSGGSARCSSCGATVDEYSLFAVFDGHNGVAAARLAADAVLGVLEAKLPQGPPPPYDAPGFLPWREDVQLALVETLAELNRTFALKGILAGCTATLVMQVGWLLTVANLGDSRALLDTGVHSHQLTVDHRVATHQGERRRVEAMGNTIAPIDFSGSGPATHIDNGVGPLRIWPGGLCLSRAIGDFDVGDAVVPFPHVMQVMVPPSGGRLLVASDGVWDAYEKMNRIGGMLRTWSLDTAPQRLIQSIVRAYGGLRDDTTLVIADIVPPGKTFAECAAASAQRAKAAAAAHHGGSAGGGVGAGCGCFGSAPAPPPPPVVPAAPAAPAPAAAAAAEMEVLADVDVAAVMGLMPGATPVVPGWYDEFVGEHLFALAAEAMEAWQEAHERRTGRRPATPPQETSVRAARAAKEALRTGEVELLVDPESAAWAPAGSGMRRSASTFFSGAVAEGDEDYAHKFGHYKGFRPAETPSSGSPGSSMHSMQRGGSSGALTQGDGAYGGRGEGSVRSGGYRYGDASVRAGSRFAGDASVRAGRLGGGDASVRAGSRVAGDPSVRAGVAYYAGGGGGGQGGGGSRGFRADPSIRAGAAFFRSHPGPRGDSAAATERGTQGPPPAAAQQPQRPARPSLEVPASVASAPAAKQREEGEEGRQHGRRGRGAAGAALAAAAAVESAATAELPKHGPPAPPESSISAAAACSLAGSTAPIPVPRSVAFGAVTVMGTGAGAGGGHADSVCELPLGKEGPALEDSPVDHASMLRQTSSANSCSVLGTIAEG